MNKSPFSKTLGAALMISGITIGIGILGLPVQTGLAGFIPSMIILLVIWALMLITGLIIAREITHSSNPHEDLGGLFSRTLGLPGRILTWIGYLVLLYGIMVAHIAGGSQILSSLGLTSLPMPAWVLIFFLVATVFALFGSKQIEKASSLLFILLIGVFIVLIALILSRVQPQRYLFTDWSFSISAVPIILCAVAYQIIVPSVCRVLDNDFRKVRNALIVGTLIPVVFNATWIMAVLGVLPLEGPVSILSAFLANEPAVIPLSKTFPGTPIQRVTIIFSMTALILSYVLQSASMTSFFHDYLAPRFPERATFYSKMLTFIPSLAIALLFPGLFLSMLNLTGGVSIVILCAILPVLTGLRTLRGSNRWIRRGLYFLLVVFMAFLALELAQEFGMLQILPEVEFHPTPNASNR